MKTIITSSDKPSYGRSKKFDDTVTSQLIEILKEQGFTVTTKQLDTFRGQLEHIDAINGIPVVIDGLTGNKSVITISATYSIRRGMDTVAKIFVDKNINMKNFVNNLESILAESKRKIENAKNKANKDALIQNVFDWVNAHPEFGWALKKDYSGKVLIYDNKSVDEYKQIKYELDVEKVEIVGIHTGYDVKGVNITKVSDIDDHIAILEVIKATINGQPMKSFLTMMKNIVEIEG